MSESSIDQLSLKTRKLYETGLFKIVNKAGGVNYLALKGTNYEIWVVSVGPSPERTGWQEFIKSENGGCCDYDVTFDEVLQSVSPEIQEGLLFNLDLFR